MQLGDLGNQVVRAFGLQLGMGTVTPAHRNGHPPKSFPGNDVSNTIANHDGLLRHQRVVGREFLEHACFR